MRTTAKARIVASGVTFVEWEGPWHISPRLGWWRDFVAACGHSHRWAKRFKRAF